MLNRLNPSFHPSDGLLDSLNQSPYITHIPICLLDWTIAFNQQHLMVSGLILKIVYPSYNLVVRYIASRITSHLGRCGRRDETSGGHFSFQGGDSFTVLS